MWKGREWIREPAIIWATVSIVSQSVILAEEIFGDPPTKRLELLLITYGWWIVVPLIVLWRMRNERIFTNKIKLS